MAAGLVQLTNLLLPHVRTHAHLPPLCSSLACGCGGIGRRARFRSVWERSRGGSSPLIRIAEKAPQMRGFFVARVRTWWARTGCGIGLVPRFCPTYGVGCDVG